MHRAGPSKETSTTRRRLVALSATMLALTVAALPCAADARNMNPGDETGGCAYDVRCSGNGDGSPGGSGWGVSSPVAGGAFDPGTSPGQIGPGAGAVAGSTTGSSGGGGGSASPGSSPPGGGGGDE